VDKYLNFSAFTRKSPQTQKEIDDYEYLSLRNELHPSLEKARRKYDNDHFGKYDYS